MEGGLAVLIELREEKKQSRNFSLFLIETVILCVTVY